MGPALATTHGSALSILQMETDWEADWLSRHAPWSSSPFNGTVASLDAGSEPDGSLVASNRGRPCVRDLRDELAVVERVVAQW